MSGIRSNVKHSVDEKSGARCRMFRHKSRTHWNIKGIPGFLFAWEFIVTFCVVLLVIYIAAVVVK